MSSTQSEVLPTFRLIKQIKVEKLFGKYNYTLDFTEFGNELPKLGIIYGLNGTGKTTILKLIYHLLSSSDKMGHRTFIFNTLFSSISVTLTDGTVVTARRPKDEIKGMYFIQLKYINTKILKFDVNIDEEGNVRSLAEAGSKKDDLDLYVDHLRNWNISTFLLGDDRIIQNDDLPLNEKDEYYQMRHQRIYLDDIEKISRQDLALAQLLKRAERWLYQSLYQSSSKGELSVQSIYENIINSIVTKKLQVSTQLNKERKMLIKSLQSMDDTNLSLTQFGLIPRFETDELIKGISQATDENLPMLSQIISSFIETNNARLKAREKLYSILSKFTKLSNEFLLHKNIEIKVDESIRLVSDDGIELKLIKLSSGEKQLLLLLFNVLIATDSASIFIIDEPEISLNVTWQRSLVKTLLDITAESNCQFIFATHSIELLTQHEDYVMELLS